MQLTGGEYVVAWAIYGLAGVIVCLIWWRMTAFFKQVVIKQIMRGVLVVLVFTPWYAGDTGLHFAPAIVVLVFEQFLGGQDRGLGSLYALITSFCLLLVFLGARQFRKPDDK
jgi:hypothetical protein